MLQIDAIKEALSTAVTANEINCLEFMIQWLKGEETFLQTTSGSTGPPKEIKLLRSQLIASAILTQNFFGLKEGDTLFCCLGIQYIGGKMMLVRALVLNLPLIVKDPDSRPFRNLNTKVAFTSMVPLQMKTTINEGAPEELDLLKKNKAILLGGASVSFRLMELLQTLDTPVFHSFATSETASHIAMRRLNGKNAESYYTTLPGVSISTDPKGNLIINGPITANTPVHTSDQVELKGQNQFRWLGRTDFVINSGGIKIFPESVESELSLLMSESGANEYLISSLPDETLGEKLVLCVDQLNTTEDLFLEKIRYNFPKYLVPKMVLSLGTLPKTQNGKPDRLKLKSVLQTKFKE